jgi:hypothetical protein
MNRQFFIVAGVVVGVVVIAWLKRPYRYRGLQRHDFDRFLRMLITQLGGGAVLVIRHKASRSFIQFAKYVDGKDVRLHFGLPRATWSVGVFDGITSAVADAAIGFCVRKTGDARIPEFLEIDWVNPTDESYDAAARVGVLVFDSIGVPNDARFDATFGGTHDIKAEMETLAAVEDDERAHVFVRRMARQLRKRRVLKRGESDSSEGESGSEYQEKGNDKK